MSARIRPFQPEDYPALVALTNRIETDYPETVEEVRHHDARRAPRVRWARHVAERDGEILGIGYYGQSDENYHPDKYYVWVGVDPERRGQGLGTALYQFLMDELAPLNPIQLNTESREDRPESRRFVEKRGFTERMREWESRLDPRQADLTELPALRERLAGEGIRIITLAELKDTDPEWGRKLHALKTAIDQDIPSIDPATEVDFDHWFPKVLDNPNVIPEARFFAVHEGQLVGESSLFRPQAGGYLDTGVTGVRREYRRKRIALALKLCAIEYARSVGAPEIRTWNATTNEAMLSINVALGFQRQPAWIFYTREGLDR